METDHKTRCAWIRQNDATEPDPYKCGATAAQMILYGRDNSKFQSGGTTLKDSTTQLRADQELVWKSVIQESKNLTLPAGAHYDGRPEWDQICEGAPPCWPTFPDALAATLTHGFTVAGGHVAGVAAKVRAVPDEVSLENAIMASIDRGVAAAVLAYGIHWIVIYRYQELAGGDAKVYFRDGLITKAASSRPWSEDDFATNAADQLTSGVYSNRWVAVTAATRVPIVSPIAGPGGAPFRAVARPGRDVTAFPGKPESKPFPDALGQEILTRNAQDPEWERAFTNAMLKYVFKVKRLGKDSEYYIADYWSPSLDGHSPSRRTGSVIVDGQDLKPRITAGIDDNEEELPRQIGPEGLEPILNQLDGYMLRIGGQIVRLERALLNVDAELVWKPCDQSPSPFLPFYRVRQTRSPKGYAEVFIRVDGKIFSELTTRRAGI